MPVGGARNRKDAVSPGGKRPPPGTYLVRPCAVLAATFFAVATFPLIRELAGFCILFCWRTMFEVHLPYIFAVNDSFCSRQGNLLFARFLHRSLRLSFFQ